MTGKSTARDVSGLVLCETHTQTNLAVRFISLTAKPLFKCLMDIRIPNSLCWSPDNQTLYFADTRARVIWKFDFNLASGELTDRRLFVDLQGQLGRPDGATVDTEGYLWSAEYGGGRVVRYTPDGTVDKVVNLPVANVTCPTFGGTDYKTLFITTASQRLAESELAEQPPAGGLYLRSHGRGPTRTGLRWLGLVKDHFDHRFHRLTLRIKKFSPHFEVIKVLQKILSTVGPYDAQTSAKSRL